MSSTKRAGMAAAALTAMLALGQLIPATALADPPPQPEQEHAHTQDLHNVTYRARVDGVARGATITYKIDDTQVNSANPTMLPGRTFEANAVLADPQAAGMQVSIQWPYSANLHCEILVDDLIVAQADQFIAPKLIPARDDPLYGVLSCGAPLSNEAGGGSVVNTAPVDTSIPADGAAPPEAPPPAN
jgi:hypothetical protein